MVLLHDQWRLNQGVVFFADHAQQNGSGPTLTRASCDNLFYAYLCVISLGCARADAGLATSTTHTSAVLESPHLELLNGSLLSSLHVDGNSGSRG